MSKLYKKAKGKIEQVCNYTGIAAKDLLSKSRKRNLVETRWIVYKALRAEGWELTKIGKLFNRDHSTVIYGLTQIESVEEVKVLYQKIWTPEIYEKMIIKRMENEEQKKFIKKLKSLLRQASEYGLPPELKNEINQYTNE